MKRGEIELSQFYDALSGQNSMTLRALVYRQDDTWRVHTAYLVNSFSKSAAVGFANYGDVGFVVQRLSGSAVAKALQAGRVVIKSVEFLIPDFQTTVWTNRYPSHVDQFWLANEFPFTTYQLSVTQKDIRLDEFSPLIETGFPSFPNIKTAALFYLYGRKTEREYSLSNDVLLQLNHQECWIDKVFLEPSSISINIKGRDIEGGRLEVWVGDNYHEKILQKSGRVAFALRNGLQGKIWIVVSRGDRWLDYRDIDLRYRNYSSKSDKNLIIKNRDLQLELMGIIGLGEGETTEFKVQVPIPKETLTLTKTVAAFANGHGGIVIVGVDDAGIIRGILGNVKKEKERLAQIVRDNLTHQPKLRIYDQKIDSMSVLIIEVTKGENPPYGIGRSNPRYFVRRGATTFPATPEEISMLVRDDRSDNKLGLFA